MAEAIARHHGLAADSAGTEPASAVSRNAISVLRAHGIETSGLQPKRLDVDALQSYGRRITMGCGVAESCPTLQTDEDWGLDDPVGQPIEAFEATFAAIERRVLDLVAQAKA